MKTSPLNERRKTDAFTKANRYSNPDKQPEKKASTTRAQFENFSNHSGGYVILDSLYLIRFSILAFFPRIRTVAKAVHTRST